MAKREQSELKMEVVVKCGVISDRGSWKKEVNVIAWGENQPKIDIRDWNEDHSKMRKGVTLTFEELKHLVDMFKDEDAIADLFDKVTDTVNAEVKEALK